MNRNYLSRFIRASLAGVVVVALGCGSRGDANSTNADRTNDRDALIADQVGDALVAGRPFSPDASASLAAADATVEHGPFPAIDIETRQGEIVPRGDTGSAHRDAETGEIVWRAYTCLNPRCPGEGRNGRPYLFSRTIDKIEELADGRIVILDFPAKERKNMCGPNCPACNSSRWTAFYEPPEVAQRRVLLEAELVASRAARNNAKREGVLVPQEHRTPMAIMRDLAALPKLYLVDQK